MRTLLIIVLLSGAAFAGCTGSSPTVTCTPDSIATGVSTVSGARPNGVVLVSAGSATYSSSITLTFGVWIRALGTYTLTATGGFTGPAFYIHPDGTAITNTELIRITGPLTIDANHTGLKCVYGDAGTIGARFAVGGTYICKNVSGNSDNGANYFKGLLRGVVYDYQVIDSDISARSMGNDNLTDWEDTSISNCSLGQASQVFFENGTMSWNGGYGGSSNPGWTESGQGGVMVERMLTFNLANSGVTGGNEYGDKHGFQNFGVGSVSYSFGTMCWENYHNTLSNAAGFRYIFDRGGRGAAFHNSYSGSGTPDIEVINFVTGSCTADIIANGFTVNNYSPYINGTYFFKNSTNGSETAVNIGDNPCGTIVQNSSFWVFNASFNGTTQHGVGSGTRASRPANCATGDAWEATDIGTWDKTGTFKGVLDKCTAPDTWTDNWYVPYTYPHPLSTYLLTVTLAGSGSGTVTDSNSYISCGSICNSPELTFQNVTLTASAAGGSSFTGWSGGGCAGTGTCVVPMSAATSVTATFASNTGGPIVNGIKSMSGIRIGQ